MRQGSERFLMYDFPFTLDGYSFSGEANEAAKPVYEELLAFSFPFTVFRLASLDDGLVLFLYLFTFCRCLELVLQVYVILKQPVLIELILVGEKINLG